MTTLSLRRAEHTEQLIQLSVYGFVLVEIP